MNTTFKVARPLSHFWWLGSRRTNQLVLGSTRAFSFRGLPLGVSEQRRRYGNRMTIDDATQAHINRYGKQLSRNQAPEDPWKDNNEYSENFKDRLDEMGFEAHCNDRLYIAKNKKREAQRVYEEERAERREKAQKRFHDHFVSQEPELRRRSIHQDPIEHQKRQLEIIENNRRRWLSRTEAQREAHKPGITYHMDSRTLEEMEQESLDKTRGQVETQNSFQPPSSSPEWRKKQQENDEDQYWHSWNSCPASREPETDEQVRPHLRRKKVAVHPPAYPRDNLRRGFHSLPSLSLKPRTIHMLRKRRPSSLEKQFHKYARKYRDAWAPELGAQNPVPVPNAPMVPKKKKENEEKKPKRKVQRRTVQPPVFRMTVKSRQPVARPAAPVSSYSGRIRQ
ncbi:hypothetical protein KR026_005315 [Drosophila bipectinata]|nr:hypothetical protein KR026_005315 [Drosophila bipectinata]